MSLYQTSLSLGLMHTKRVKTALVMFFLGCACLLYLPKEVHNVIWFVASSVAMYEWSCLGPYREKYKQIAWGTLVQFALWFFVARVPAADILPNMSWVCSLTICNIIVLVCFANSALKSYHWLCGYLVQGVAWYLGYYFYSQYSHDWQIAVLLTILADVSGYLVGMQSSSSKRPWPFISPNKTYSGSLAMIIAPCLAGFLLDTKYFMWTVGAWSLLGDLFVSCAKRYAKQKDCGSLLPGHGGLLDRVDSHLAVWIGLFFAL
mgnify:CR=1 FL=1